MSFASLFARRSWLLVLVAAAGLLTWSNARRVERLQHVATLSRGDSVPESTSPTGYRRGVREWVLPDRAGNSSEWLAQTQRMLATGEWRIRRVAEENAPVGRVDHTASPYRWWLGIVARIVAAVSGEPIGIAVERAARYADPALHLALLLGFTVYVARRLGNKPACGVVLGLGFLFPLANAFTPGVPDETGLQVLAGLGSVLPLVSATVRGAAASPRETTSRYFDFALAGCFGALGIWLAPSAGVPVAAGVFAGALLALVAGRPPAGDTANPSALPWRVWALSGAVATAAAYFLEYAPGYLGEWEIRAVHPLYSLAWLGAGELLHLGGAWRRGERPALGGVGLRLLFAAMAIGVVPYLMERWHNPAFLLTDFTSFRLTRDSDGAIASHLLAWLRDDGGTREPMLTLVPVALGIVAAVISLVRRRSIATALALGPMGVATVFATFQLHWWMLGGALLVALLVAVLSEPEAPAVWSRHTLLLGALAAIGGADYVHEFPRQADLTSNTLSVAQGQGILERDLAHWLARRSPPGVVPVVHATPGITTSLNYYGGLRGLGTRSWESGDGLTLAVRVAICTSREEALTLLRGRGITHVVIASYDSYFETHTRASSMQVGQLFHDALARWSLPTWLRPLPYRSASIPGFAPDTLRVFEVVDDQGDALAAARLTEYFIEMEQLENAEATRPTLLRYPADLGVAIARAQLEVARNDPEAFTKVFEPLVARITAGADRNLLWERRVALAVVLARGNRLDLARAQAQRCLAEATEARLRTLTTNTVFYLLALNKNLGLQFRDPALQATALELLTPALRESL